MKIIAIIAEYNPFHNGHEFQIKAARDIFGADSAVVAVMSGCFTQRGEPALLDKWTRTKAAIACGADLVLELPFAYAAASAERFADGAVSIFRSTGLEMNLIFGSESGNIGKLQKVADLLADESEEFRLLLRENLKTGISFPDARQKTVAAISGDAGLASLLSESNNILAVEYLKALKRTKTTKIKPYTIQRRGQAYKDVDVPAGTGSFASAGAIRALVRESVTGRSFPDYYKIIDTLKDQMPSPSLAYLLASLQNEQGVLFPESLASLVISRLRSAADDEIARTPGMEEGLGQRLGSAAKRPGSASSTARLEQLVSDAATRRFPRTRVQRALIALLAGITLDDYNEFDNAGGPGYLRVLGFNRRGRYILKLMRKLANVPVITKASDFAEHKTDKTFRRLSDLDILAADLWMLAAGDTCGRDFDMPVFIS